MEDQLWHKFKWPKTVKKSLEYPNEPLFRLLDKTASVSGNFPYLLFEGSLTTFRETKDHADRIATFLHKQGIRKGDRIAIFLPNLPHYPAIFFGILKTGAVAVTCNPHYTASELNFQLRDSGARMVFCMDHKEYTPTAYKAAKDTQVEKVVVCSVRRFLPKMKKVLGSSLGMIPKSSTYQEDITVFYDDVIKETESGLPLVDIVPQDDLALILYTGGTTGTPKGAMLTHSNLYANILQHGEYVQFITEDSDEPQHYRYGEEVLVGALPWFHSYGLTLTMMVALEHAASVIVIPDPRTGNPPLSDLLALIQKHKATVLHAVPTLLAGMVSHPHLDKYDLTSLIAVGSGAAPLPPELGKRFEDLTGCVIFEGYGLTETSPQTHANPTNKELRKFGTVGFPIPDTLVKIVDLETGKKELPLGEDGEIALAGPQIFKGYWNRPEQTEAVFRKLDGIKFFLTGDIGHLDEEGFTVITDRKKDMINVSGLKAYPREIEDILFEHPKVELAAVIGLPRKNDPSNEYVKAYIVLREGASASEEEIIEWCRTRMAGYKRPREVEFRDELPMSAVGKVLRRVLRDEVLS
ncbi:MAG: long-chain fatty acid--CoA ligase [Candidatus Heimdallarchaeota archaeon]